MKVFTLRKLAFGAICPDGDCNFPTRAEALGSVDIEGFGNLCKHLKVKPGSVVVDVGAFVGDTAIAFAKHGCEVIAVEPFFDSFVSLVFNTYGMNVRCINAAAGRGEPVKLVYECPGPNYGMRSVVDCAADDPLAQTTLTIDSLKLPKVDFIKIDCEGSEIRTLEGARETIARDRPMMFIEMYKEALERRQASPESLKSSIEALGYTTQMIGEPPRWDWLCIPK